ncbi:MAG: hypothetical protein FJ255_05720 [Phycisphaerae bacterium]|nr:hypothetical protein [Phycisphaerae bacterium]
MQGLGRFQAVRRLYQRGLAEVWSARPAGQDSGEPVAIKAIVFDPLVDREQFEAECERFIESARTQRSLVERGAGAWARVHEVSKGEDEAGFVLDHFRRSAQKLIASKAGFDDRLLRWLVGGVLAGVQELRRLGEGRAWGRLRSSNIFIGGERELGDAPIVLSDLKPAALLTPSDHAEDSVQLGRLIYQAVMRRELGDRELLLSGTADSPEWSRLGAGGAFWRRWCDRLLGASGAGAAGLLEELARELGVGESGGAGLSPAVPRAQPEPPKPGPEPVVRRPVPTEPEPRRGTPPVDGAEAARASEAARPRAAVPVGAAEPKAGRGGKKVAAIAVVGLVVAGGVVAVVGMGGDKKPVPEPPVVANGQEAPTPPPPPDPRVERARSLRELAGRLPEGAAREWWADQVPGAEASEERLAEIEALRDALERAGKTLGELPAELRGQAGSAFVAKMRGEPLLSADRILANASAAVEESKGVDPRLAARLTDLERLGSSLPGGAVRTWWTGLIQVARREPTEQGVAEVEAQRGGVEALAGAFRLVPVNWQDLALAAAPAPADPSRPTRPELDAMAAAVSAWFDSVVSLDADASKLQGALDEGRGLGERVRLSGGTDSDLLAAVQRFASAAAGVKGVEEASRPTGTLLGTWGLIEAARSSSDAAGLVAECGQDSRPLAAALASWRRLADLTGWPATPADVRAVAVARTALLARVGSLSADRAEALGRELTAGAASHWQRAWDAAGGSNDPARMRAIAAEGAGLGVAGGVVAAAQFAAEFAALRAALDVGGNDEAVQGVVDAFSAAVSGLALSADAKARVGDLVRALTEASRVRPRPPAGPAWMDRASIGADGEVSVTIGGVAFVFVPVGGGSYLGSTEVSLAMANALLAERAGAVGEMQGLLGLAPGESSFRRGMRAWRWADRFAVPPAERLPDGREVPGWVAAAADSAFQNRAGQSWYADELAQQPSVPTLGAPLQRVSAVGAAFLSGLIECRLPTLAEWSAGVATEPAAEGEANLRDRSWAVQLAHWDGGVAPTATPVQLEDVFVPQAQRRELRGNRDTVPANDGSLWTAPVDRSGGSRLRGLIGNVAEYVTSAAMPPAGSAASATAAVGDAVGQGGVLVVGGSALSPPALAPREALALTTAGLTYSDVGFRLAFTSVPAGPPPAENLEKVRGVLAAAPSVPVRAMP